MGDEVHIRVTLNLLFLHLRQKMAELLDHLLWGIGDLFLVPLLLGSNFLWILLDRDAGVSVFAFEAAKLGEVSRELGFVPT